MSCVECRCCLCVNTVEKWSTFHKTMTTSTPYATLFASYGHNQLRPGSREACTPRSAALLSAHLGLLSSIFGRGQTDVLPLDCGRMAAAAARGGGGADDATDDGDVRVELESGELWRKFDAHSTEMVITKSGRYDTCSTLRAITGAQSRAVAYRPATYSSDCLLSTGYRTDDWQTW